MSTPRRKLASIFVLGCLLPAGWREATAQPVTAFPPERAAILLVATRTAMAEMEPEVWEEPWGDQPEDSQIEREIIWWELASPGNSKVHPAVGGFEDLARLATEAAVESGTDWLSVLREELKPILVRTALSLIVAEQPEHIDVAEMTLKQARTTNSAAEIDVSTIEDRWKAKEHRRLEKAASSGRYLPVVRFNDLAAIMPDRLAGRIRHSRDHLAATDSKCAEALSARNKARAALRGAIYAKAARHAKRRIEKGHKQLDKGNDILNCEEDADLREAISAFDEAEKIFRKAEEAAEKPKLRVH